MSDWVTSEAAAEYLGVSRPTVRQMVKDGRLQPLKYVNGRIMVFDMEYLARVKPTVVRSLRRAQKVGAAK
jgi:excisionase family DNA binding protein